MKNTGKILNDTSADTVFTGRTMVLATMHGKEAVIAPILEKALGVEIIVPKDFDTDRFGTFTGDIPRAGNQLEAARLKARAALLHTGFDLAVASEGSFSPDPSVPFVQSSLELVVCVDTKYNLEIIGQYRSSDVLVQGAEVESIEAAFYVARKWGFPRTGIIMRKKRNSVRGLHKNIRTDEELKACAAGLFSQLFVKKIYMETDMRAHRNPARMKNIQKAAEHLAKQCKVLCPSCQMPGFVATEAVRGAPCTECRLPTTHVRTEVYTCTHCHFSEERPFGNGEVNAQECDFCNP